MPYTNVWDANAPLGSADANTIDNIIRALKVDIQERMNDILENDWADDDDDPKQIDLTSAGARTGVIKYYSPYILQPDSDLVPGASNAYENNNAYWEMENANNAWALGQIDLPINAKLTDFRVLIDTNGSSTASVSLFYAPYTAGSVTPVFLASLVIGGTGIQDIVIFTGEHTIATKRMYRVRVDNGASGGSVRIYGFEAVFDVDGLTAYI